MQALQLYESASTRLTSLMIQESNSERKTTISTMPKISPGYLQQMRAVQNASIHPGVRPLSGIYSSSAKEYCSCRKSSLDPLFTKLQRKRLRLTNIFYNRVHIEDTRKSFPAISQYSGLWCWKKGEELSWWSGGSKMKQLTAAKLLRGSGVPQLRNVVSIVSTRWRNTDGPTAGLRIQTIVCLKVILVKSMRSSLS